MPWGEHRGKLLHEVPHEHLEWVVANRKAYDKVYKLFWADLMRQIGEKKPLGLIRNSYKDNVI